MPCWAPPSPTFRVEVPSPTVPMPRQDLELSQPEMTASVPVCVPAGAIGVQSALGTQQIDRSIAGVERHRYETIRA